MTDEEKQSVVQDVLSQIKTDSQSVDELEQATSLDGLTGLPALQGEKLVTAPLTLLSKPATDAAATANTAAESANTAATAANEAVEKANTATTAANTAAEAATTAAETAKTEAVNISQYDTNIALAKNGATARFVGFVEGVTIEATQQTAIDGIYYDKIGRASCRERV